MNDELTLPQLLVTGIAAVVFYLAVWAIGYGIGYLASELR